MTARHVRAHVEAVLSDAGGAASTVALRIAAVLAVLVGGTVVVYATGGTKFVWPHLMYFAVVLAGVTFGRRVGVLTGVVAGILMGPFVPLDVAAGIDQPLRGWLIRMGFYVAIGTLAGYTRYRFHRLLDRRRSFLASVSHELRTPLSAAVGFADVLDKTWDDLPEWEKREMIGHILRESVEVAHVVDDLLVAARLDSGRCHIEPDYVNVRQIADSILESLPPELASGRVRVDGSAEVWVDPIRVKQIMRHLLTNALVHGGDSVAVDLSTEPGKVVVTIRDDGPGIPDLILPRLFEPFVQRQTVSTMPQSVGLGLAVSRELARRMGGRLTYYREDGYSIFSLELPSDIEATVDRKRHALR